MASLGGYLVYMLIDPRTSGVFYVGITSRPRQRWDDHHNNPSGAVYHRLRVLRARGLDCLVRIMGEGLSRKDALRPRWSASGASGDEAASGEEGAGGWRFPHARV